MIVMICHIIIILTALLLVWGTISTIMMTTTTPSSLSIRPFMPITVLCSTMPQLTTIMMMTTKTFALPFLYYRSSHRLHPRWRSTVITTSTGTLIRRRRKQQQHQTSSNTAAAFLIRRSLSHNHHCHDSERHYDSSSSIHEDKANTKSSSSSSCSFRLLSWNLLAPVYCSPSKYYWCHNTQYLEWSYRKTLIMERLRTIQADIVCLQEVQIDLWKSNTTTTKKQSHIQTKTEYDSSTTIGQDVEEDMGLESYFQKELKYKTTILQDVNNPNHPVANAILIRRGCGLQLRRVESRSRALIAVFEITTDHHDHHHHPTTTDLHNTVISTPCSTPPPPPPTTTPSRYLYLANVHLDARTGIDHDVKRYQQLLSLFKRLYRQIRKDQPLPLENFNHESSSSPPPAVILCGDFNFVSTHPLYHFLATGKFDYNNENDELYHLFHDKLNGLTDLQQQVLSDLLPLQDVFAIPSLPSSLLLSSTSSSSSQDNTSIPTLLSPPPRQELKTNLLYTYSSGCVLDYIWTSPSVNVLERTCYYPPNQNNNHNSHEEQCQTQISSDKNINNNDKGKDEQDDNDEDGNYDDGPSRQQQQQQNPEEETSLFERRRRRSHPGSPQPWPSVNHPSDHLPISALITI